MSARFGFDANRAKNIINEKKEAMSKIHKATVFTNMVFDDSKNHDERLKAAKGMMENYKKVSTDTKQKYKDISDAFPCFSSTDLQKYNKYIESEMIKPKNEGPSKRYSKPE
jgi:hypothetical protein